MNKMLNITRQNDEYETPLEAVKIIEPYLKRKSIIWCPFDKKYSNFVSYFQQMNHKVIYGHIETGQDFFTCKIPDNIDYIISNPPYSKKDEIYEELYKIGLPFAMLVNLQGFCDSKKRAALFSKYGVQVMYIYPRIRYIKNGIQTSGNIFQSGYVCKDILPKDLMICFEDQQCD